MILLHPLPNPRIALVLSTPSSVQRCSLTDILLSMSLLIHSACEPDLQVSCAARDRCI